MHKTSNSIGSSGSAEECQELKRTSISSFESLLLPVYRFFHLHTPFFAMGSKQIAGVTVPDTPLITSALELARKYLTDWEYNHIVRSWLLGCAIADRLPGLDARDKELHSIAAILHDLGWDGTGTFTSKDKCFEVDGANAAREFVEKNADAAEWDHYRKQLLWDCIALHTYASVALHKEPEVVASILGIATDFWGPSRVPGGVLTNETWENIAKEYPRSGFKTGVIQKMCGFCKTKPETTYDNFVGDFGEEMVEGYSRKGHRPFDL